GDEAYVFILDMGEPIRIVDLARDLIQLSGHREEDIDIVFTGLRPGEKLYEELRLSGETTQPTRHPRIVITALPQLDHAAVARIALRLERAVNDDGDDAIDVLHELVPEFVSQAPSGRRAVALIKNQVGSM